MVNVTGGFDGSGQTAGYRVNPRPGEFAIAVPYDPSLLPQGFTEDDIQTYVYDRQHHRWAAIQRDSVNEAELLVCSRFRPWEKGLPHTQNDLANPQDALAQVQDMMSFAPQGEGGGDSPLDFINAVLKTPEMPETSAYTPTSIAHKHQGAEGRRPAGGPDADAAADGQQQRHRQLELPDRDSRRTAGHAAQPRADLQQRWWQWLARRGLGHLHPLHHGGNALGRAEIRPKQGERGVCL